MAKVWGKGDKPNVKVRGAVKVEVDGIKFRSKLESYVYRRLKEEGFNFLYESRSWTIIEKFEYMGETIRPITIKPDFVDEDNKIIIEVKGWATDTYKLRLKLFKRHLMVNRINYTIYHISTQKALETLILDLKKNV
jgi:hypothetical protein